MGQVVLQWLFLLQLHWNATFVMAADVSLWQRDWRDAQMPKAAATNIAVFLYIPVYIV